MGNSGYSDLTSAAAGSLVFQSGVGSVPAAGASTGSSGLVSNFCVPTVPCALGNCRCPTGTCGFSCRGSSAAILSGRICPGVLTFSGVAAGLGAPGRGIASICSVGTSGCGAGLAVPSVRTLSAASLAACACSASSRAFNCAFSLAFNTSSGASTP